MHPKDSAARKAAEAEIKAKADAEAKRLKDEADAKDRAKKAEEEKKRAEEEKKRRAEEEKQAEEEKKREEAEKKKTIERETKDYYKFANEFRRVYLAAKTFPDIDERAVDQKMARLGLDRYVVQGIMTGDIKEPRFGK